MMLLYPMMMIVGIGAGAMVAVLQMSLQYVERMDDQQSRFCVGLAQLRKNLCPFKDGLQGTAPLLNARCSEVDCHEGDS